MAIAFQDFFPRLIKQGFLHNDYETLHEVLERANSWLAEMQVQVINVETVTLPNISQEEHTTMSGVQVVDGHSFWCQFIRVWYAAEV